MGYPLSGICGNGWFIGYTESPWSLPKENVGYVIFMLRGNWPTAGLFGMGFPIVPCEFPGYLTPGICIDGDGDGEYG